MGLSFKISKKGTRYRPNQVQSETLAEDPVDHSLADDSFVTQEKQKSECIVSGTSNGNADHPVLLIGSDVCPADPVQEVSFSLNLLPNGFSFGMPTENGKPLPLLQDVPKLFHPYDRASEALFSAIEFGILPGDLLDEIPCKYRDGTVICEIRDYRKCATTPGNFVSGDGSPVIHKVHLRMSMENVVKDIPSITDSSWSYGDLLEVESRIVKALQPVLHLDPAPMLDKLRIDPAKNKLNLGISLHRKKMRQSASVQVLSHSLSHGKKVSIDRVGENEKGHLGLPPVDGAVQHLPNNVAAQSLASPSLRSQCIGQEFSRQVLSMTTQAKEQPVIVTPKSVHNQGSGVAPPNSLGISAHYTPGTGPDSQNSYKDQRISSVFLGKRENHGMQMPPNFETKRPRQDQLGLDGIHNPPACSQLDYSLLGAAASWKSTLQLQQQQQLESKRLLNANLGQKHPQEVENNARQTVLEGIPKADTGVPSYSEAMRYHVKVEQPEFVKLEKQDPVMGRDDQSLLGMVASQADTQLQSQQTDMRFHQQSQWHNLGHLMEKYQKKDDASHRRKQQPNPRVSGGTMENSPGSSKSGEICSGSLGANYSMNTATVPTRLQKENPVPGSDAATGATSISCGLNDSIMRQHQNTVSAKRKPISLRTSAVDSPGSVNNPNLNASSPSVGTSPVPPTGAKLDSPIDRFLKLEMLVQRYGLNCKKNKVDEYHERKPFSHSPQHIMMHLSNAQSTEDVSEATCAKSLSKSLLGGSMNVCKTRILECVRHKQIVQVNGISHVTPVARYRLCMSERAKDGMVEALVEYGVEDENGVLSYPHDALPTLPNTNYADLFAVQFSALMIHEGYEVKDQLQLMPNRLGGFTSGSQSVAPSVPLGGPAPEMACQPPVSGHTGGSMGITTAGIQPVNSSPTPSQSLLTSPRLQHSGVAPSMHMQPGYSQSRQPQLDPSHLGAIQQQQPLQPSAIQQQQQYSQLQRSSTLGSNNPLAQLNPVGAHVANQIVSSSSNLQLQILQQQPQQQQQQQPQMRKVMGALSGMGMATMGNGMVSGSMQPSGGAGGLGNFVGLSGIGMGMGHMGPSMSAPTMPGLGNMGQMGLNSTSNASNVLRVNPAVAAKLRMMQQNRGRGMLVPTAMRSSIDSLGGIPGTGPMSMLGQTLNRTNIGAMQLSAMSPMGPPKIPGTNFYMNQQQQFQQLQLQQQQMQLQQQQQQLGSPSLQQPLVGAVQQQVGSPSGLTVTQQMNQQAQLQTQPQPQPQPQTQQQISPQQLSPSHQLSSGAIQQLVTQQQMVSGGGAGPASPQLSSQTIGSVGSITSSPMDLQRGSKSNSNVNTC